MEYHGLLQAFSRTNRVLNEKKRFGKIVCFRDMKSNVDDAIKLFSCTNNIEEIVRPAFDDVKKEYIQLTKDFLKTYPSPFSVDELISEPEKKSFVLQFRDIIRKHTEIKIYDEFEEDDVDFPMSEQQFADFTSKYLDILDSVIQPAEPKDTNEGIVAEPPPTYGEEAGTLDDIDFCLELLHSDIINVAYIIELISDLDPYSDDYAEKRKHIIDTMIKDAEMRNKAKLIDGFIQKNVDEDKENFMKNKDKIDGSSDLEERLNNYVREEKEKALRLLSEKENVPLEALNKYISEYDYLQQERTDILQDVLKEQHLGLIKRRNKLKTLLDQLRTIIRTFNWD